MLYFLWFSPESLKSSYEILMIPAFQCLSVILPEQTLLAANSTNNNCP